MRTKKQATAQEMKAASEAKAVRELAEHLMNLNEFLQNGRHALPADMQDDADIMARYIAIEAGNLAFDLARAIK